MPKISFTIGEAYYKLLEALAKQRGVSVHQLVKEITELYLLRWASEHRYQDTDTQVGFRTLASEDRYQNNDIQVGFGTLTSEHRYQDADPENSGLAEKLDALDKKLDMLVKELRKQQDLINAYTGKADQVLQRLSQLVEALEAVSEKLDKVAEGLEQAKVSEELKKQKKEAKREKTTVCDVLHKQLVVFESEIADKIRNRDAFFSAIESKCGDIVVEGLKERVAVERNFWQQFLEKLSKIDTSDDEKIKKSLDSLEYKLFKALKESALIIFDATAKKWNFVEKQKTNISSGTDASTAPPSTSTTNNAVGGASQRKKHYKRRGEEEDESWLLQYVEINDVEAVKH
jgi:predicted DNA-binding ribbon-helix-helix protein/uncharacterized protein YukE